MARSGQREAARARAAEERERQQRLRRRRRTIAAVGVTAGALVIAGGITALVLSTAASGGSPAGRTTSPPWSAPSDVEARVEAAGLTMLTTEGTALHIHQHLTVTVDGRAITVPADIGVDENAQQLSAIHTHDTSGVIHVESPEVRTFYLGQVFTEWNVRLARGEVGPYRNDRDGVRLAVFVNRRPYTGDPTRIALSRHEDIDIVVTHGAAPTPPKKFAWPSGL